MQPSPPRSGRRHQAFCVICTANCTNVTPSPGRRSTCEAAKVNTHAQTKTRHPHGAGSTRAYGGPRIFVYRKFGAHTVCVCVCATVRDGMGKWGKQSFGPEKVPKKKRRIGTTIITPQIIASNAILSKLQQRVYRVRVEKVIRMRDNGWVAPATLSAFLRAQY